MRPFVDGTGSFRVELELDRFGSLSVGLDCEVHGPPDAPPVVVLGGISASRHLLPTPDDPSAGWWPGIVGRGCVLDPARHRLIGIDWLGRATPEVGPLTTRDQARAVAAVLAALEVQEAVVVGASYGGMVGLALANERPSVISRLVVLCAAHRPHPMATAIRWIQRRIASRGGRDDLALARALAMTTYRSHHEFESRFDGAPPSTDEFDRRYPVTDYLMARGEAFADRFTADGFCRLSESIDLHWIDPREVVVPITAVAVDSDTVVPPFLVQELVDRAPFADPLTLIRSPYGHDAFLKETRDVGVILSRSLDVAEVRA